jgi:polysaccharide deacetylase family protein (PEP-CTERM system associated)
MKNIMTVDLEDWYTDTDFREWNLYEDRISSSTHSLLSILEKGNASATFFVMGYMADRFPELIKEIAGKGHEIAIHGYNHQQIYNQTSDEFEKGILYSLEILNEIINKKIIGFRAPQFSLIAETRWAIPIIAKYFRYDSSIVPAKTPLYGIPDSPRIPYKILVGDEISLMEFPMATYEVPILKNRFPVAGGFYLRLFPYKFNKYFIKSMNKNKAPAVCYIHPWELDTDAPRLSSFKWYRKYNLHHTSDALTNLVRDFNFQSIEKYLNDPSIFQEESPCGEDNISVF